MAEKLAPLGQKKMNWHMALIYFILWLMAFMNLCNGLINVFGVQLGDAGNGTLGIALHTYPDMNHVRIFILDGVFTLIMCIYTVFVRFQLAGFKRRAPIYLTVMFALNIAESVVYVLVLNALVPEMVAAYKAQGNDLMMTTIVNSAVTAVVAGLTYVYYLRRKELFTK